MQVILDEERWEAADQNTLGQVLAELSEKAHGLARMVISLTLDQRAITDRDLEPALLDQFAGQYRQLRASSCSMGEVRGNAQQAIRRYAGLLRTEACALADRFRRGDHAMGALDAWCGQLADYVECLAAAPSSGESQSLSVWVQELLKARTDRDPVRLADVLEYELAPRLGA